MPNTSTEQDIGRVRSNETLILGCAKTGKVSIGGRDLDITRSLKVVNKSPNGFAWGYHGSGPAQLGLAILLELCDNERTALNLYQRFKSDMLASTRPECDLVLPVSKVQEWIEAHKEDHSEVEL